MESLVGCQGYSSMAVMLSASSLGGTLGYPAGVIKPGGVVLAVLVGVVQVGSAGEFHLLTSLKEQSIHSSCFQLGIAAAGGLMQVLQKKLGS